MDMKLEVLKNLIHCCKRLKLDYDTMLAAVDSAEVKQIYENNTKEPGKFGIFGVPSLASITRYSGGMTGWKMRSCSSLNAVA